jgi:hypothetical protein
MILRRLRLLLALLFAAPAAAHLTPNSEVRLDFGERAVTADIIVPQGEYAYATGNSVTNDAASQSLAGRYLAEHMSVHAPDGRAWAVQIERLQFVQIAGPPDLHAVALFTPPAGAPVDRLTLDWRAVIDAVPSHFALIVTGEAGAREVLGAVRQGSYALAIDRSQGAGRAFAGAVGIGAHHILGGTDHLMFLLALLLPAPLIAAGGRWTGRRPPPETFVQLARIVTAFTIGHSVTLVGATLGGWALPVAPVEVAIAVSVLVSAIHALRPLFPGREPLIAGGFGLVHGLAFATLVRDAGVGMASSAVGLLGFNLGIELVQLAIVCLALPALLILSASPRYALLRVTAGVLCAGAASVWIAVRTGLIPAAAAQVLDLVIGQLGWAIAATSAVAVIAWLAGRKRAAPSPA